MNRTMLTAIVLGTLAAAAGRAEAGLVVDFSYASDNPFGASATGTGSFSIAGNSGTVGLADVSAFQFTLNADSRGNGTSTFNFGLADLKSFSATIGAGSTLTSLSLATNPVNGTANNFFPESFTINSLGADGATTQAIFNSNILQLTTGPVTITSSVGVTVPEPSSLASCGIAGLIGLGLLWRRRGRVAAAGA